MQFTSSISDEDWHCYWGVNVHGVFYCTREALRLMEPRHDGKIINIASIAGMSAYSAHSPDYSATKGAVIAFTRAVALDVAGANIFVNAIAPGGVLTPDFAAYFERSSEEEKAIHAELARYRSRERATVPLSPEQGRPLLERMVGKSSSLVAARRPMRGRRQPAAAARGHTDCARRSRGQDRVRQVVGEPPVHRWNARAKFDGVL